MGLDVWFREDVARALRAAHVAGREAHAQTQMAVAGRSGDQEMAAYWRGYEAALATVGAAFGVGEVEVRGYALTGRSLSAPYTISLWESLGTTGAWE